MSSDIPALPREPDLRPDCSDVDWQAVSDTLKSVGMAHYPPDAHRRAFEASHAVAFAYYGERLVGFGRVISDGVYQAAIYDCAVAPSFQGRGVGAHIMDHLLSQCTGCNIILYASPGKEGFYEKHGFRKMMTGMALFTDGDSMRERGFTQ